MQSKINHALELSKRTREKLSDDQFSLTSLLQDCKTICRHLGISAKHEWIDLELKGYNENGDQKPSNLKNIVPEYRIVLQYFYDMNGRTVEFHSSLGAIIGKLSVSNPIAEIIVFQEHGMIVTNSPALDMLNGSEFRTKYKIDSYAPRVVHGKVSSSNVAKIINDIKSKIYEFLDELILELEYGNVPESIFDSIRQEVDEKFIKLCPSAIEKLPVIYEQLSSDNAVVYSQIAGTCRQIINDVADSLYPQKSNSKKHISTHKLDSSKSINRILERIASNSEQPLFKSMFEYTDNFLHSIQKYASKGDHSQFKKSDAIRCVVYTYILLGDILHYYIAKK